MTLGLADLTALAEDDLGLADDEPTAVGPEPTRDTERIAIDAIAHEPGADEEVTVSPETRVVAKPTEPSLYPRRWRRW